MFDKKIFKYLFLMTAIAIVTIGIVFANKGSVYAKSENNSYGFGYVDGFDPASNKIGGWTYNSYSSGNPDMKVDVYINSPAPSGQYVGRVDVNFPRADVTKYIGVEGYHGFNFRVPDEYLDGVARKFYFYGVDRDLDLPGGTVDSGLLNNGEITIQYKLDDITSFIDNHTPSSDGLNVLVKGWVIDNFYKNKNTTILVFDDDIRTGNLIQSFETDVLRFDVNQKFGINGEHGFVVTLQKSTQGIAKKAVLYAVGRGNQKVVKIGEIEY